MRKYITITRGRKPNTATKVRLNDFGSGFLAQAQLYQCGYSVGLGFVFFNDLVRGLHLRLGFFGLFQLFTQLLLGGRVIA